MKYILAVDQSTSATKALLFDSAGQVLVSRSREHAQIYPRPGWVEHDAEEIYQNTLAVLREVISQKALSAADLLCLSITNQRETVVIFERSTGKPLTHAIVWQCRRSAEICEHLEREGAGSLVRERTGLKIDPYFSSSKVTWLMQNEPRVARALQEGTALIGTIDAYLVYRLTNGSVFASDHSNASRTLLLNCTTLQWDDDLCRLFQVPRAALPELRESAASFGATTLEGLLHRPIPIYGVMGDSQAALFAQRCTTPGAAKTTFGTGASVLMNIGGKMQYSQQGLVTALAWVLQGQPTYAFEGIIIFGAASVAWLKNQLGLIQSAAETETLAMSIPDNGGVYLVPAFAGLAAPYWAPSARGAIVGLTPSATRAHIARAALESIGYQIHAVLQVMAAESGIPPQYLHGDGGATKNRFLMQFVADLIGFPVRVPDVTELSPLGAVYMGMLGTGAAASLQALAQLPRTYTEYTPTMDRDSVRSLVQGWEEAVRRVL